MAIRKPQIYVNRYTGEMKYLNKHEARKLSEDWGKAEQITNKQGERGMRLQLNGATVDILENNAVEVASDGDSNTK